MPYSRFLTAAPPFHGSPAGPESFPFGCQHFPTPMNTTDPMVMGSTSFNLASKLMGTAMNTRDMTIMMSWEGLPAPLRMPCFPTLKGRSVSGSMARSFRNAGNTGRYASRNITGSVQSSRTDPGCRADGRNDHDTLATWPTFITAPTGIPFLTLFLANTFGISPIDA